jgi:hypothetical protein
VTPGCENTALFLSMPPSVPSGESPVLPTLDGRRRIVLSRLQWPTALEAASDESGCSSPVGRGTCLPRVVRATRPPLPATRREAWS